MRQITKLTLAAGIACLLGVNANAVEGPHHILIAQDFDSDTVGSMPSGWSGLPTVNANAYVTNNPSVSSPNSFAVSYTNGNPDYVVQTVAPFTYSLTNAGMWIAYEFDVNVDYILADNSEGFNFRLWNGNISQIDVGSPRILANSGGWQFYNGLSGVNGGLGYLPTIYSFDSWHHLRIKIQADGNTGPVATPYFGRAFWYVDNILVNTETWTDRSFNRVQDIDTVDIRGNLNGAGGRMFVDNLVVEAIPEPTAVALTAAGGLMLLFRRRK